MELSSVFNGIHFLEELKNALGEDRFIMLEYITPGQMSCIGEIARRIYHHTFPLFIRDVTYFEDRDIVLQVLFSEISFIIIGWYLDFSERTISMLQFKIKYFPNKNLRGGYS